MVANAVARLYLRLSVDKSTRDDVLGPPDYEGETELQVRSFVGSTGCQLLYRSQPLSHARTP